VKLHGTSPPLSLDAYTGPASEADTVRFLEQASWGPTPAEVTRVKAMGFMAYLNEQFSLAPTNAAKGSNYPDLPFPLDDNTQQCPTTNPSDPNYNQGVCFRDNYTIYPVQRTFFSTGLYGNDQLRQRVAFALHQILVVSANSEVNRPNCLTVYLQSLDRNAFGSYQTLLNEITLTPTMGEYLDMRLSTRTSPNENFAREVLQLFSIGTDRRNGRLMANGLLRRRLPHQPHLPRHHQQQTTNINRPLIKIHPQITQICLNNLCNLWMDFNSGDLIE
jgi:hypothetical protein